MEKNEVEMEWKESRSYCYLTGEHEVFKASITIDGTLFMWSNVCVEPGHLSVLVPLRHYDDRLEVIGQMGYIEAQEFVAKNHARIADHIAKERVKPSETKYGFHDINDLV